MDDNAVLDPTGERTPTTRERAAGPTSLDGLTIGLLDISKQRGDVLPRPDRAAPRRARGHRVVRFAKPTFTKAAPIDLRHEIAEQCDVVIEALAD